MNLHLNGQIQSSGGEQACLRELESCIADEPPFVLDDTHADEIADAP